MKRVLIVDDAAFMRMAIKNILVKHGYEVADEAENGQVGISKYKELKPDLVTMDITMPEMEAIKSGAKSFIVKPFKEDHVIQTLSKVLP